MTKAKARKEKPQKPIERYRKDIGEHQGKVVRKFEKTVQNAGSAEQRDRKGRGDVMCIIFVVALTLAFLSLGYFLR